MKRSSVSPPTLSTPTFDTITPKSHAVHKNSKAVTSQRYENRKVALQKKTYGEFSGVHIAYTW